MTHMDDKTNQAPEQSGMPDNEEYSSYTLPTEDAAAQEAHTIPLEDAAAQESRTIPLEDERTQGAQDSAAQPAKKKSPLPWIIGGAAVVIAAAITLILTLKPKTVSPDAEQPAMRQSPSLPVPPTLSSQTIRPLRRTARPANRRTARKPSLRATA